MPYTSADVERMKTALATGELEVQAADGTRVRYQSFTEMQQRISYMEAEIRRQSAGVSGRGATMYPTFIHSRER